MPRSLRSVVALCAALTAFGATPALGAVTPEPFRHNDFGGFRNILPPGTNGSDTVAELAAFRGSGKRPAHNNDQLSMYSDLIFKAPHVGTGDISNFFKDASFGVASGQTQSTESPRADVTILRDKAYGVPHIYGSTRGGAIFGTGYVAAEDRLFFIDVLRHAGRAQLASFAGGAAGNRSMDADVWRNSPYREQDLQAQFDRLPQFYGAEGTKLKNDVQDYTDGVNAYIQKVAPLGIPNPSLLPAEYPLTNNPNGPTPWKVTDVFATAALVGGIFGKGGGNELSWSQLYESLQKKFGARKGAAAFNDFRAPNDPEAPTTIHNGKRFPYRAIPRRATPGSIALPDRGSVRNADVVTGHTGNSPARRSPGVAGSTGLLALPHSESNALLVSARHSRSGHPEVVFGPQVGYFSPQILMEQDVHAPTIDADGAAFPGVNLYVQLGRGRDYAWSATSAGQDIVDTFAVPLCNPSGGKVDPNSRFYTFRGKCVPMEVLTRTNSYNPSAGDMSGPGSETLTALRTQVGIVTARARIHGKPIAYTKLRSTYFHELDSARGFSDYNDPAKMRSPQAFQRASSKIGFTFNWLYTDDKHIAYFNSGNNPVRAKGTNPLFPVNARFEWRNFNPKFNTASYTPASQHPQAIDQDYLTSWNNKQAPGFNTPDTNETFSSIFRSQTLDDRVRRAIRGTRKASLADIVNGMEDAGTVDLRGDKVLPWALKVIGRPRNPTLRHAVNVLRNWNRAGAHRRDLNRNGRYDQAGAVKIMDAWWPNLIRADLRSALGSSLLSQLESVDSIDNPPHNEGDHLGSAYDVGFYGHVQKDLRGVLHRRVRGHLSRIYCGRGSLKRCRAALSSTLLAALRVPSTTLYQDEACKNGDQRCYDEVRLRPLGGITQPGIPWINRPTFQQVVEIKGHGPR